MIKNIDDELLLIEQEIKRLKVNNIDIDERIFVECVLSNVFFKSLQESYDRILQEITDLQQRNSESSTPEYQLVSHRCIILLTKLMGAFEELQLGIKIDLKNKIEPKPWNSEEKILRTVELAEEFEKTMF